MMRRVALMGVMVMSLVGCSPTEEAELTTTTTTLAPSITTATTAATTADQTTSTVSPPSEAPGPIPTEVVQRSTTDEGEVLWVVVPPGDYTDIDLENVIGGLVEEASTTLGGIHVFDDAEALDAGRIEESARTEDEQSLVDAHYLASLEGTTITFRGPFAELGQMTYGS